MANALFDRTNASSGTADELPLLSIGNNLLMAIVINKGWLDEKYEWPDQAKACGTPYDQWKESIINWFLLPKLNSSSVYLEIGPGMGRWASAVAGIPRLMWLVEPDTELHSALRNRVRGSAIRLVANKGDDLPGIPSQSVDFVWSYDVFVHLSRETAKAYLGEIRRVLRPGGTATLHYGSNAGPGGRTDLVSLPEEAIKLGLNHVNTVDSWGSHGRYHCRLFCDRISSFSHRIHDVRG